MFLHHILRVKIINYTFYNLGHSLPQDHHHWPPTPPAPLRLPPDHPLQCVPLHQVHVHDRGLQAAPPLGGFRDTMVKIFSCLYISFQYFRKHTNYNFFSLI